MKSRNTYLLLVLLIVVAVAAYFMMRKGGRKTTFTGDETEFAVADTAAIDRIFISTKEGRNSTLERRPGQAWLLDGKYDARQDMMNNLLLTINQIRVKRPVSKEARNTVIKTLAAHGVKVEIYQQGQKVRSYFLAGNTEDMLGTYFIMQGSENPYVVHIPGFDGFVNSRYDVQYMYWRKAQIFNSIPNSIRKIELEYPKDPGKQFTIINDAQRVDIPEMNDEDTARVKRYLTFFGNVHAEFFFEEKNLYDSLRLLTPTARLSLTDANPEKSRVLSVYRREDTADRHYAILKGSNEVMSIQSNIFDVILLDRKAFSKKEEPIRELQ